MRGRRAESPILLKLHGGPGQAEMATAGLNGLLEDDFVVVEWDQRGSGKSGAAIRPARAMNVGQLVADTIELTEYLTQRLGRRKLIVVGHSWGSVLGLMAVQRRPDLFGAFVSTGLMANFSEGQQVAYRFLLAESRRHGNTKALTELSSLGSPPYAGTGGSRNGDDARAGSASSACCGTALRSSTGSAGYSHPGSTRGPRSSGSTGRPNALSASSTRTCCP